MIVSLIPLPDIVEARRPDSTIIVPIVSLLSPLRFLVPLYLRNVGQILMGIWQILPKR